MKNENLFFCFWRQKKSVAPNPELDAKLGDFPDFQKLGPCLSFLKQKKKSVAPNPELDVKFGDFEAL